MTNYRKNAKIVYVIWIINFLKGEINIKVNVDK